MTEQEWLTSTDPAEMLREVTSAFPARRKQMTPFASDRKLRLFACACCRQVWDRLTDERSRKAVEVAERFADVGCSHRELEEAEDQAMECSHDTAEQVAAMRAAYSTCASTAHEAFKGVVGQGLFPLEEQSALLRDIFGNPWRPVDIYDYDHIRKEPATRIPPSWLTPTVIALARTAYEERATAKCGACYGRVFVPDAAGHLHARSNCPSCLGTGRVKTGHLDPDRLLVLADALEEAGCQVEEMLLHLRGYEARDDLPSLYGERYWKPLRGPHVRGCWCVDALIDCK